MKNTGGPTTGELAIKEDIMEPFMGSNRGWFKTETYPARSFKCGFCGDKVSSEKGYRFGDNSDGSGAMRGLILICPSCKGPIFFPDYEEDDYLPNAPFGNQVNNLPKDIGLIYDEARRCTRDGNYTASVLICRKALMHIAVECGAKEGKGFLEYVNHLSDTGYIPPNGKRWVDYIRRKGNEANHQIVIMSSEDAEKLLVFLEMMLKIIYEFPGLIPDEVQI